MSRWPSRTVIVLLAFLITGLFASPAQADEPIARSGNDPADTGTYAFADGVYRTPPGVAFAPDRLLVKFRTGASAVQQFAARQAVDATVKEAFGLVPGLQVLKLHETGPASVVEAAAALSRSKDVEYAMPDFAYQLSVEPDDPSYLDQWALPTIGAPAAWSRSTGSSTVTVAILDTGVDLDHPDLVANLVPGWNFVADNAIPEDDIGHGTHVAGIIGAVGNNATGVSGVNWSVKLMPLKICDEHGLCYLSNEIAALEYAVAHGARVANASFGALNNSWDPERDAIAAAGAAGLLYVAAAGNNAANSDTDAFYPADYPLDTIVSVGASNSSDELAYFSNYGPTSVDLVAPGLSILSTVPDGYDYKSGTSMAAPQVTGAAAMIAGLHPTWTPQKVRRQLIGTATPLAGLVGKAASCGRLNLDAATNPSTVIKPVLCVIRRGSGLGNVTSTPAGIDCGPTCIALFTKNTQVTLTASPAPGSAFGGWSAPCADAPTCILTMSAAITVIATFVDASSQGAWTNVLLTPPGGRDPLPSGSYSDESFYNVSMSADGKVRAKTLFTLPYRCYYASSDTGGVFLERKTKRGWVSDGMITAPELGPLPSDRWMNCAAFGTVAKLSGDGSTLLITSDLGYWPQYRCAAFVYRRIGGTWQLDGTLYPAGLDVTGTADFAKCGLFGQDGAISFSGDRVAINDPTPYNDNYRSRVVVFARGASGWALERTINPPLVADCAGWPDGLEHRLAMSGDGATILIGDPFCNGNVGRVYHYSRIGSIWTKQANVANPDLVLGQLFGGSVAISADGLTAALGMTYNFRQSNALSTSWIFELSTGVWTKRTRLEPGVPDPEATFACTSLVRAGQRIVCATRETLGFNEAQGSLYVFNRPASGWSAGSTRTRLFARFGYAFDRISVVGRYVHSDPAVREDGNVIDATVGARGIAVSGYKDRIGYEFRR
jgi:Subtilase family/Fervidolysin N-terminal prodomain/Divergent InlB B-repeat domain